MIPKERNNFLNSEQLYERTYAAIVVSNLFNDVANKRLIVDGRFACDLTTD